MILKAAEMQKSVQLRIKLSESGRGEGGTETSNDLVLLIICKSESSSSYLKLQKKLTNFQNHLQVRK